MKIKPKIVAGTKMGKSANRKLDEKNTALYKNNKLLKIFKAELIKKGNKEKATLISHIKSDNTRNTQLKKTVAKGKKESIVIKVNNASLQEKNKKLKQSNKKIVNEGVKEKAVLTKKIQSGKTQNKKLEHTVQQGNVEIKRVRAILKKKDTEIDQLNRELLTFTYISSHDLQEPLRNIQVIADLILEKERQNLSTTGKDYFLRLQKSAKKIQRLIQDLIEYANFNKKYFKVEPTDLNNILKEVKKELKKLIAQWQARIKTSKLPTLTVAPSQFHKLFKELILNAIKFSKPNVPPQIIIQSEIIKGSSAIKFLNLALRKTYYHISFNDKGIGFEAKFGSRIFEMFQKLHVKEQGSSGIGLATCKKIVENYGGKITASSDPVKGTTFDIYLPLNLK